MRDELQRYLDGELSREELPEELARAAERWNELLSTLRAGDLGAEADAPPWLAARIREAVADAEVPGPWWRRVWQWMVQPQTIELSPVGGLAGAAALALALMFLVPDGSAPEEGQPPSETSTRVAVQFSLEAPDARSVALAGDFSGWEPAARLTDADGDGVWTGRIILSAGVHQYMFLVDGERWVTDPRAERYMDDGFGRRNAVVALAPAGDRSS